MYLVCSDPGVDAWRQARIDDLDADEARASCLLLLRNFNTNKCLVNELISLLSLYHTDPESQSLTALLVYSGQK